MDFRMFMNQNKYLTEDQKARIAGDIQQTLCFNFPDTAIVNENPDGFTQLRYMCGGMDLFDRYGQYKSCSDFEIIKGLPSNDRGKKHNSDSKAGVEDENAIVWLDNVLEIRLTKEFALFEQESLTVSLQSEPNSLDIPEDNRQKLFDLLEDKFKRDTSKYIHRVPYKWKYVTSVFAPFAHVLLALKYKLKRTDAKKELHSVYYLGTLSVDKVNIDFSTYFTISDYWYYEMETGINLCVEIAGTLLYLLDQTAIEDTEVEAICTAVKECLCLINPYSLLIRLYLVRNCIQYGAAYMQAVRQNPRQYIIQDNTLKSPIKDNMPRTFQQQISYENQITIKFEAVHLIWVFSEILRTIEFPFRSQANTAIMTDSEFEYCKEHFGIPKGFLIAEAEDEYPKCALAFCNLAQPYIKDYINYVKSKPNSKKSLETEPTYSKNLNLEKMFIKVHSIISNTKE